MDGSADFRPEPGQRSADPSIEEMLRRAGAAHVGGDTATTTGHLERVPIFVPEGQPVRRVSLRDVTVLLAGICVGALLSYFMILATTLTSQKPATPSPPTTAEIAALARDYYNDVGPFAGRYTLWDVTAIRVESQNNTQLTACIAYEDATIAAPDTLAGSNTRLFTLRMTSDGIWQVVRMGDTASCHLD